MWNDYGELRELTGSTSSMSVRNISPPTKAVTFVMKHFNNMLKIVPIYFAAEKKKTGLDVAIDWWIRSKIDSRPYQPKHYKLIELRIALEALYLRGSSSDISSRLPIHAAWHLGTDYSERKHYHKTLRKVYKDASSVIHAREISYKKEDWWRFSLAQNICRKGILKRLEELEEPKWEELILDP